MKNTIEVEKPINKALLVFLVVGGFTLTLLIAWMIDESAMRLVQTRPVRALQLALGLEKLHPTITYLTLAVTLGTMAVRYSKHFTTKQVRKVPAQILRPARWS